MNALSAQLKQLYAGRDYKAATKEGKREPAEGLSTVLKDKLNSAKPATVFAGTMAEPFANINPVISSSKQIDIRPAVVKSSIDDLFNTAFAKIEGVVEYNPNWANGTGYFDGALKVNRGGVISSATDESGTNHLLFGKMKKSTDDKNRRMIFIGTRMGTIIVFERYIPDNCSRQEYVYQGPNELYNTGLCGDSRAMSFDSLNRLLGGRDYPNIGEMIENIYDGCLTYLQNSY